MQQNTDWTEVIQVHGNGRSLKVWLDRGTKIDLVDHEFTFRGDTHGSLFPDGHIFQDCPC